MDVSLPSAVLEVSTNAGPYLAPTARDKLDLRVAKQSVNLWQATVAATACHRASGHAEQDDGCAQQVPERAPTRGRWRAKAPDQGPATTSDWPTSANATRVIAWRHQARPSAPRPPAAGAGPAAAGSAHPGRGWPPASPDGWRPWPAARGPRSAPQDPSGSGSSSPLVLPSRMPRSSSGSRRRDAPRALPVVPGSLPAKVRALPSWQASP